MSSDNSEHDSSPLRMLPVEVCDLIFQHLTGELLMMSEVSPSFYNFVAGSRQCMKEIRLELTTGVPPDEILQSSSRKYERFLLSNEKHADASREVLSVVGRKWKEISIYGVDFETVNEFLDYMRVFQSSVEKLSLNRVYVVRNLGPLELPLPALKFPNLKSLEMICSFASFYDKAFVDCKNLTSFSIKSGGGMGKSPLSAIRTILRTSGGLKFLKIDYEVFYLLFNKDFSKEISFKLKLFHADSLQRPMGNLTRVKQNLNAFLMTQRETIEVLTLGKWMGGDVFKTILLMPRSKHVTLRGFGGVESVELRAENFLRNNSVTQLDVSDFCKDDVIRFLLTVFPKVETVTITGTPAEPDFSPLIAFLESLQNLGTNN